MDKITHTEPVMCKYCGAFDSVKYGTFEGMQRHFCKICRRKFADNDALPRMKTPVWVISSVLHYYYDGMSIGAIQKQINQQHGAYYAQSSIYNWVMRFSKQAIEQVKSFHPRVGNSWLVCETILNIGNRRLWFWDIFDIGSKYLLVSRLSEFGTVKEISALMESAYLKAGKLPEQITTTMPMSNFEIIHKIKDEQITRLISIEKDRSNATDLFHSILKKRNRIMHGFNSIATIQILTDTWLIHYNFIAGDNRTQVPPAQKTDEPSFKSWADLINPISSRKI